MGHLEAGGWICATCGNHPGPGTPPEVCAICADERQWVPATGQRWTTLEELAAAGHRSELRDLEPGLVGVGTEPAFAIGQRGLLVRVGAASLLWDPSGFLDAAAVDRVRAAGGLVAVSASHPHFYGAAVAWSRAFGDVPILLPDADRRWLTYPDATVQTWSGSFLVGPGVTLVQCGGHFPGSAVVHWAAGAGGRGALLAGDTVMVTPGEDRVTFLRSAPNRLPLPEPAVRRVVDALLPYAFDRIYSGWWEPVLRTDARRRLVTSAERYLQWLRGELAPDW